MSASPRFNGRGSMMYKANQPQFFKIILPDSLRQNKLSIPRKFVKNYGNKLQNSVILKVSSGDKWRVGILKVEGQIWLEKGWYKFVECYSIVVGSLLVFRYDESISGFNVTIFDSTCSEIDYPYRHSIINEAAVAELKVPKVESDHDIPVEIISGHFSSSQKRKEKSSPLSSSPPHKKLKKAVENFTNITGNGINTEAKEENRIGLQKHMVKRKMKEKSEAIYRASSSFPSQNPTFKTAIHQTHLHSSNGYLEIPAKFVRKYMKKKVGDALFDVLNGKTWSLKYSTNTPTQPRTRLKGSCWKEFAQGNHLTVGDVCKFELIDPDKALFKVVIFRSRTRANVGNNTKAKKEHQSLPKQMVNKIVTSKKIYLTLKEKGKHIHRTSSSFQSEIPTFQIAICPSHVHPKYAADLDIPVVFARKYIKNEEGEVLLNVFNGRTWCLKYHTDLTYGQKRIRLMRASWDEFARDNHLQVGDVCKFELIDPRKDLFTVAISRNTIGANAASGSSSKQSMYKETSIDISRNTLSLNLTKAAAAETFTSLNPFFQVVLTSWHLKSVGVSVPRSFIKNMDKNKTTQNVKLVVNGKRWNVKLFVYPNYGGNGKLCAGWGVFARENYLKVGDVCTFELIDTRELLIKVSVSRD